MRLSLGDIFCAVDDRCCLWYGRGFLSSCYFGHTSVLLAIMGWCRAGGVVYGDWWGWPCWKGHPMTLLAMKQHLQQVKIATLGNIAQTMHTEPDLARDMLKHWVRKGCIRQFTKRL